MPRPRGRPRRIINLLKSSSAPNNITAEVQACQQIDNVEFADAPVQTNENELTPDLVLNEHVTPAGSEDQERVEEPSTNNLHDLPACTPVENFEESGKIIYKYSILTQIILRVIKKLFLQVKRPSHHKAQNL